VLPVSEAEMAVARAAAEAAAEAAEEEGLKEEEVEAVAKKGAAAAAAKGGKGKKGASAAKGKKGAGGKGKGGAAAAEPEFGAEDEGQQMGPKLLVGGGRVKVKPPGGSGSTPLKPAGDGGEGGGSAAATPMKAEPMQVDDGGSGTVSHRTPDQRLEGGVKGEEGAEGDDEEDVRKLVAPLEELDDSGEWVNGWMGGGLVALVGHGGACMALTLASQL